MRTTRIAASRKGRKRMEARWIFDTFSGPTMDIDNEKREDKHYFSSYFDVSVHELMLKDSARTKAYEEAIKQNKSDFEGKVILDVGAGTGILSLFAAKYGAKKVYAVEASDMHSFTRLIAETNAMDDVVEVIHGKIEDIELPEKVDVIISEWMGFYLLHEAMLDSVLYARDKFLKPGGKMYPSKAIIYAAPVNMEEFYKEKFVFWEDVYGFDFSVLVGPAVQSIVSQPKVLDIEEKQLLATPLVVKEIDCNTVTVSDLREFETPLTFHNEKDLAVLHGFGFWFDVLFEGTDNTVTLSTSPGKPKTHWKQTIICFSEIFTLKPNDPIECKVAFVVNPEKARWYNLTIEMASSMMSDDEAYDSDTDNHEIGCSCIKCAIIRAYTEQQMVGEEEKDVDTK